MNLNRGFLDIKRLGAISLNSITKKQWLIDYISCISNSLQVTNNNQVEFEKNIDYVVKFNGQMLALKEFVNDRVDILGRRTLIKEYISFQDYSFYGYATPLTGDYEWQYEVDPNYLKLGGYANPLTVSYEWNLEPAFNGVALGGYWNGTDWVLEGNANDINISIMISNDVYSAMSVSDVEKLESELANIIIAPFKFEIIGYATDTTFNGTSDYINLGITPNKYTILKNRINFLETGKFGVANAVNEWYLGKTDSFQTLGYGDAEFNSAYVPSSYYLYELNGINKNLIMNSYEIYDFDSATFDENSPLPYLHLGAYVHSIDGITYTRYTDYGGSITKNNIVTVYTPHPEGYYFDNFGNKYYNRESLTNEFPLTVNLTTYKK